MVDGAVHVNQRVEIAIRIPAIADDRRAWFDPFTYNSHQRVGGYVRNGNKKFSAGHSFDSAKRPLTLNRVPSIVLSPTDLSVNFDGLIRATDFVKATRKNSSMVSLQNMPQSATVWSLTPGSFSIWWAGLRRRMPYIIRIIFMRVRILSWNHDPCLMDAVPGHLITATLFRHRHLNPSARWGLQTSSYLFRRCYTALYSESGPRP